ncbi:outer membrane protein [Aureimonas endophytica]|nr:outer membrane protein [Aureimonas endophytica]
MQSAKSLVLLALLAAGLPASARAADILDQPIESPSYVPVEIGSSWYLRGDVAYDFERDIDTKFTNSYQDGFGATIGRDGSLGGASLDANAAYSAGFGYQVTDFLRGDLTAHYWQTDLSLSGSGLSDSACPTALAAGYACSGGDSEVKTWEVMANAYLDLGTFVGVTPYVGAGVGAARVKYDLSLPATCLTGTSCGAGFDVAMKNGEDDWRFAFALMGGASYDLTPNLKLDVGYRYVNIDSGEIGKVTAGGGTATLKDDGFDRHTIQAGLRYSLF